MFIHNTRVLTYTYRTRLVHARMNIVCRSEACSAFGQFNLNVESMNGAPQMLHLTTSPCIVRHCISWVNCKYNKWLCQQLSYQRRLLIKKYKKIIIGRDKSYYISLIRNIIFLFSFYDKVYDSLGVILQADRLHYLENGPVLSVRVHVHTFY